MKRVTIMIGIPGSGKSTLARMLHGSIVSADNFHLDKDGQYNYRHELAGQAHLWCLETFIRLLEKGERHIIVDNTNTRNFERAPYVQMAKLYGYVVEFMKMSASPEEAHERCVHGLSLEQVQAMHDRMEELPSYWEAPRDGARILDARLASCEPVDTDVITDALQKAYNSADPRPETEEEFTKMIEEVLDPGVIWHLDSFTPTGVGLLVQGPFAGKLKPSGSVSAIVRIHRRQHSGFILWMSEPLQLFDPTLGFDNPPVIVNGETYRSKVSSCSYAKLVKTAGLEPEQHPIVSWTSPSSKRCGVLRPGRYLDTTAEVIVEVDLASASPLPSPPSPEVPRKEETPSPLVALGGEGWPDRPTCHEGERMIPGHDVPIWKRNGTCWYCGSIAPELFLSLYKAGDITGGHWADFKYGFPHKLYLSGPASKHYPKFYTRHLFDEGLSEENLARVLEVIKEMTGLELNLPFDGRADGRLGWRRVRSRMPPDHL
jgi:predicted kinase